MKKIEKSKNSARKMVYMSRAAVYGSLGLIMLTGLAMLFPMTNNSHAVVEDEFSGKVHTDIKTYVRSTIALAVSGQVNLDLTPKSSGTFGAGTAKLTVSTNNVSGYSLYLAMADSSSNSLLPMNTRSAEEIGATPATLTAENYADYLNTWGYMIGKDVGYKAVPKMANAPVITESIGNKEASYDLSFAVAVGTDLPAGVYGNQVLISAVANPIEVRGINDITFMQEMTSDICAVSFEGETKQLIDSRDGKSYWVAKLKDGNCWMVQNLALDLSTEVALTPEDSDVRSEWRPMSQTNSIVLNGNGKVEEYYGGQYSWNFGQIVLATPLLAKLCNAHGDSNSVIMSDNFAQVCAASGFVDVSSEDWKPTFMAQEGTYASDGVTYDGIVAVDLNIKAYDAHYLIGNYYQFSAATASGYSTDEHGEINESICPKNWQLPASGKDSQNLPLDKEQSFYRLLRAYGFPDVNGYYVSSSTPYTDLSDNSQNISESPLSFMRSGYVNLDTGTVRNVGRDGGYWSNVVSGTYAARLSFDSTKISPSSNYNALYGYSVRCLAR